MYIHLYSSEKGSKLFSYFYCLYLVYFTGILTFLLHFHEFSKMSISYFRFISKWVISLKPQITFSTKRCTVITWVWVEKIVTPHLQLKNNFYIKIQKNLKYTFFYMIRNKQRLKINISPWRAICHILQYDMMVPKKDMRLTACGQNLTNLQDFFQATIIILKYMCKVYTK